MAAHVDEGATALENRCRQNRTGRLAATTKELGLPTDSRTRLIPRYRGEVTEQLLPRVSAHAYRFPPKNKFWACSCCVRHKARRSQSFSCVAGVSRKDQRGYAPDVRGGLFRQRAVAIGRHDVGKKKIRNPRVGVNLIFNPCEAVTFVFVDFVVDRPATFLDGVHHLLRF